MSLVPQLGMAELLLLGVLALIVVGPKDLPKLMREVGRAMAKVRRLADDFRMSFEQMARETEVEEMRAEIEKLKQNNPMTDAKEALKDVDETIRNIDKPASAESEAK